MTYRTYFSGEDSSGREAIWSTNGTVAGTVEIATGYGESNTPYGDFTAVGSRVVFEGEDSRFVNGLFVSGGTARSTFEIVPKDASSSQGLDPADLANVGSKIVFNGIDNQDNYDLWVTDGTASGTKIVAGTTNLDPRNMLSYNGEVLFTSINKGGLWTTNGSSVKEVAGTSKISPEELTVAGSKVYFTDYFTGALYTTDGTSAGTKRVTSLAAPLDLTGYGSKVVFEAEDKNGNYDLYVSNGTASGTHEVAGTSGIFNQLVNSAGQISPDFVSFQGKILFEAVDKAGRYGLWSFNGTTATEITGIKGAFSEGIFGTPQDPDFNGPDFAVYGKEVIFDGISPGGRGAPDFGQTSLWITNGTAAGTKALKGSKIDGDPGTLGLDASNLATLSVASASAAAASPTPTHGHDPHMADLSSALFEGAFGHDPIGDSRAGAASDPFGSRDVFASAAHGHHAEGRG